MKYLNNIKELNEKVYSGHNTRKGRPRNHIYKVNIKGYKYFKFQIKRNEKHYIVYFKKKNQAILFMKNVAKNKNLINPIKKFKKKNSLKLVQRKNKNG